jgi:DNA-binding CsgD family transcriptional regulator
VPTLAVGSGRLHRATSGVHPTCRRRAGRRRRRKNPDTTLERLVACSSACRESLPGGGASIDLVGHNLDRPVGRDVEVQRIVDVVRHQGACYLHGAAGIGKSLVLSHAARQLASAGADVISCSGSEATAVIPLAPLLKLCPPGVEDAGRAIMAELYRRSRGNRTVVLVDDAHLLDDATAAVVRQMASAPAVGVAIAVRSGAQLPASVDAIRRDGQAVVLELSELDRPSSYRLVELLLGPTEDDTLAWIHSRTRGHPLYLRELLVAGRQTGALQQHDGRWRHESDAPVWTARLHALVANRLRGLSPTERRVMELVAVGGTVPFGALSAIVDLDVLVELARRRLLAVDAAKIEMDHPIIAETLLATMGAERATSARLRLAAALERHPEDRDPVMIVQLRLDAGQPVDPELLVEALDAALVSRLPQVAERFASVGCQVHPGPSTRMRLVESLAMQGRWGEAEEQFELLSEECDEEAIVGQLERWVAVNFWYRDDLSTIQHVAVEAQARIGDRGTDAWHAVLLRIGIFSSNLDASIADHDRWLTDRRVSPRLHDIALVDVAACASHSGAFHRIREIATEFDDDAEGADPVNRPWLRGIGLVAAGWTEGLSALSGELDAFVGEMAAIADPDMEVLGHVHAGMALNDLTCHAHATRHLMQVVELSRYARYRRHIPLTLAELARALVFTRDLGEARGWFHRAAALPADARWVSEPVVRLVEGILEHAAGRDPWAPFDRGLDHARRRSARIHEVMLLHQMAQYGRPEPAAERLRELSDVMDATLTDLIAREAEALAAGDAGGLDEVAADADAFGAIGIAADAAAQASRRHAEAGRVGSAFASLCRSDAVLRRAPGQRSLVRQEVAPILSSRERQVVDAVLDGASNREVAERLYISHRTVESHLRRIYRRLGVSGREELTVLLAATGSGAAVTT